MNTSSQTTRQNRFSRIRQIINNDAREKRNCKGRKNRLAFPDATPTRRIYSAAGQRLENILKIDTSSTKDQGNGQLRSDSRHGFLLTSRYLSLLSEEDGEIQIHADRRATTKCPPRGTSTGPLGNSILCEKFETGSKNLDRKHFILNGRRKKLTIVISLVFALVIGLTVGLTVGLRNASKDSNTPPPQVTKQADPNEKNDTTAFAAFPLGTHSIATFLDSVRTDCVSNPSTWTCYPYNTISVSPIRALSVFNWVIGEGEKSSSRIIISSTSNPFALNFPETPLTLIDEGAITERYQFEVKMNKSVIPSETITNDGTIASCNFDDTSLLANLYTKKARTYPIGSQDYSSDVAFPLWPFAVQIEQIASTGSGIPSCYSIENGVPGDSVTTGLDPVETGNSCSCLYKNVMPSL